MNEKKTATDSMFSRAAQMKERINDLEDRNIELIQLKEEKELRFKKSEEIL